MRAWGVCFILAVCFCSGTASRIVHSSGDTACAFYLDAPVSLSDEPTKDAFVIALKTFTGDAPLRFNNGTNDVAVILKSHKDAVALCNALTTDLVLPEDVFGSLARVLPSTSHSISSRKCTYGGSCRWWWGNCQLYRTCGKGYVTGGVSGAGDLYGSACTSSCKSKCYSYCQCPNDTSCYGKK